MNKFYAIILSAGLLTLGGCAGGDEPGRADAAESRLTVSIADGGFGSDSRAEEVDGGYATAFTEGDECGLYLVRNGRIIYNNMKLTATAGDDGAIAWKPEADLNGGLDGESYFVYYPYRSEMTEMSDLSELSDDAAFFGRLIDTWEPAADQSDYADYTASDLMTAQGRLMRSGASTAEISFAMTHRMALAVVEMPKTVYKFTEAGIPYYVTSSAADFADSPLKPCRMADGSYRCIVKPASGASLCGIYENNGTKEFAITASATQGSYKTYRVDGAPVTEQECTLKAGDYFCKNSDNNWYVIPQEATPDGNVIGVVFWTPDEPAPNNSFPSKLSDDMIMRRDHPECTHGLVISLKNIGNGIWQKSNESLWYWQKTIFNEDDLDLYNDIANSESGDVYKCPTILGYQNTIILRSYNTYCKANDRSAYICQPVVALDEWSKSNPAPQTSTGWYIPSAKELSLLAQEDIYSNITSAAPNFDKIATVTASIDAVKGDNPYNIAIFSSTEYILTEYTVDYKCVWTLWSARIGPSMKLDVCHFRPVLAF